MSFYNPMQAGPDWGGGIQDLMSQFMMMKMILQMYPDEKGKKGEKTPDISKVGEMFFGKPPVSPGKEIQGGAVDELMSSLMSQPQGAGQLTPVPPARDMSQLPIGQSPMPQGKQIDLQQIMQMLGGIPGLMR